MKLWAQNKRKVSTIDDRRINIIMAAIFLLGVLVVAKLYDLQVRKYDFYSAKASGQHNFFSILEPERGNIFIQDNVNGDGSKLYPLAADKKFALLYCIPAKIKEPEKIADILYEIFKKEKIEKEVAAMLKDEDEKRVKETLASFKNLPEEERKSREEKFMAEEKALAADSLWQEMRKIKREAEINLRKEAVIKKYLSILNKGIDPYEPLEQKVDEEILKNVYVSLSALNGREIKKSELSVKDDAVFIKNAKGEEEELKFEGMGHIMKTFRFYPEKNIGSHLLGFVGFSDDKEKGRYGLEEFFDEELSGRSGSIKSERGAGGDLVIINEREYVKPQNGSDLILAINRAIQFAACQKLNTAVAKHGADGGSVIIMDPKTGAILAMCSAPDYDPNNYNEVSKLEIFNNPAIFSQYEPGSIFKGLTMAMALDQGKVTPQTTYNDTGTVKIADYNIENSDKKAHGTVDMATVLEESLNTGAIFAMRQIGPDAFRQYVENFGFGEKTGIEMETEAAGDIKNLTTEKTNKELYAATASFGQGIAVTPLQMVSAFGAIANGGILMKPYVVKEVVKVDGSKTVTTPRQIRRVISEKAATILGGMLVNVVENGHGKKAGVKGYYVSGKTGTAQVPRKDGRGYEASKHIGSFAGFAPAADPRFAMLVRIDNPRDVEWAESSAAPLFGEIAEFLLNYWQVPTEREVKK